MATWNVQGDGGGAMECETCGVELRDRAALYAEGVWSPDSAQNNAL